MIMSMRLYDISVIINNKLKLHFNKTVSRNIKLPLKLHVN